MKNHADNRTLSAYLDGELAGPRARRLDEHLHECAACAAQLAALESAASALRRLPEPAMTLEEQRALRRTVAAAGASTRARVGTPVTRWALAGSLVLIAVVSIGFLTLRQPGADQATSGAESGPDSVAQKEFNLDAAEEPPVTAALPGDGAISNSQGDEAAGPGARPSLVSAADVERFVLALPEVSSRQSDGTSRILAAPTGPDADNSMAMTESADAAGAEAAVPVSCAAKLAGLLPGSPPVLVSTEVLFQGTEATLVVFDRDGPENLPPTQVIRTTACEHLEGAALSAAILFSTGF